MMYIYGRTTKDDMVDSFKSLPKKVTEPIFQHV